jgi:Rod binding domain-containing protein
MQIGSFGTPQRVTQTVALHPTAASSEADASKAAREFEGILLSSLLSQLQESFKIPGADEEAGDQETMRSMGLQALGVAWAESGGIGFARIIAGQLNRETTREDDARLKSAIDPADSAIRAIGSGVQVDPSFSIKGF